MTKATCSVTGCDRPAKSRDWCRSHYMHWYTYGEPGTGPVRAWGRTSCSVDGCERRHYIDGYCRPHGKRVQLCGDPGPVEVRPQSVGDHADYYLVHLRLKKARGPARHLPCVACDGPAKQWAYDHEDPEEKIDQQTGLTFSLAPDHYQPMCVSCHMRFDRTYASGTPAHLIEMAGASGEN